MSWLMLLMCLGTTMRLWRVYEVDVIGEPLRKLADRVPEGKWGDFTTCPACLGFWMMTGIVTLGYFAGDFWLVTILYASLSLNWVMLQLMPRVEEEDSEL